MGFYDLEDSKTVMPFAQWLLHLVGLRNTRKHFMWFLFGVFWVLFVPIVPRILFKPRAEVNLVIRAYSEFIFATSLVLKLVCLALKTKEFEKIEECLNSWSNKENPRSEASLLLIKINQKNDSIGKLYYTVVGVLQFIYCVGPVAQTLWIYYTYDENSSKPIEFKTPMEQEFYGLDIRTNLLHYSIYTVCATITYIFTSHMVVASGIYTFCSIKCCSSMLQIISLRLRSLSNFRREDQRAELRDIVEMHVDTLKCIETLEDIMSLAVLVQILSSAAMACLMAFYLINTFQHFDSSAFNVSSMFFVLAAETYGLCVLANGLLDDGNAIREAVYDTAWYEAPLGIRKSLIRIMQRAQKPVGLTAAGFFLVDIERFAAIMQFSFSVYVVLKNTL